jgi:hypothetical protein
MLRDNAEELEQPDIVAGKLFRLRFRIPYPVFLKMLGWTKAWHEKRSDTVGREHRPTELKLLGDPGRDTCFDGIKELSGISAPTTFFHQFAWCVESVRIMMFIRIVNEKLNAPLFPCRSILSLRQHPKIKRALVEAEAAYSLLGLSGLLVPCMWFTTHGACALRLFQTFARARRATLPLPATWMQP